MVLLYLIAVLRSPHLADVQQYIELLNNANRSATSDSVDEVARWWASIVSLAAHWIAGDDEMAEKLYPIADAFPKHLQKVE